MRLPLFFAFRYLFSKKSVNAINIISFISLVGVLVSTATLVIVLSFYNGLEQFILSQYSSFSPELRIEPAQGKLLDAENPAFEQIKNWKEITSYTEVLEEKILAEYQQRQFIGRLKGLRKESLQHFQDAGLLIGNPIEGSDQQESFAILGTTAQANLQIPLGREGSDLLLHSPDKHASASNINPLEDIRTRRIQPTAVLGYQMGFEDLIIVPLSFARDLLGEYKRVSAIELYAGDDNDPKLQQKIAKLLGEDYLVKNRQQQNPTLYKTVRSEKWIVFFIVAVIGVIAIFNIIGSLTMLVIDKKKDMQILNSLGAPYDFIQRIFFFQGILIALMGSVIGTAIGLGFCLLQQQYGFVTAGGGSLFDAYPVDIRYQDIVLILATVLISSTIIAYISSRLNIPKDDIAKTSPEY